MAAPSGASGGLQLGVFLQFDKNKAKDAGAQAEAYIAELQRRINNKTLTTSIGINPKYKSVFNYMNESAEKLQQRIKDIDKQISKLQDTKTKSGGNLFKDEYGNILPHAERLLQIQRELMFLRERSSLKGSEINKRINKELKDQEKQLQKINNEYKKQDSHLQNIMRRMAVYASVGAIGGFLTKVREVTAEFELQRVSLGAIIQDQNRANALFSEIKNYALKSPVKILDLTRYTKQLAAYQIETDKLFETTKRLTDVAVGLGTDMSRLILAYGETKASHVLNAKELRQFAMMGIPMLELLSEKLSEINHKTITTAETFKMIKNRMVGFDVVSQVFEDLTNKGGIFYNMQEKQGNTLYGMWQKLGDAASVMYDSIGNTAWVNAGMKMAISGLRELMLAWRDIGRVIATAGVAFLAFKANSAVLGHVLNRTYNLTKANVALSQAQYRLNTALESGNRLLIWSNKQYVKAANNIKKAAQANNFWAASLLKVKAAAHTIAGFAMANLPMLAITGIMVAWQWIDSIIEKANRLKNALKDIQQASFAEQQKSVQNFESLVNKAISNPKGSKESRDALEELHNTYGKIIPIEDLQIEKLKAMQGNYALLTQAIRENIAEQKRQEGITTILDTYAEKIKKAEDAIKKQFSKGIKIPSLGGDIKLSDEQIGRIIENYKVQLKKMIDEGKTVESENVADALNQAFHLEGIYPQLETFRDIQTLMKKNASVAWNLAVAFQSQEQELKKWDNSAKQTYATLGKLADLMKEAQDRIENHTYTNEKGTYTYDEEVAKTTIDKYLQEMEQAFKEAGITINLNDFITFDNNGDVLAIDWEGLISKIDTFMAQYQEKEQNFLAQREAYRKQFEAETAKGKDADEQIAQQYLSQISIIDSKLKQLINPEALKSNVSEVRKIFEDIVPKNEVVSALKGRLELISTTIWGNLNKGMDAMRKYSYDGTVELRKQVKDWKEQLDELKQNIYQYSRVVALGWMTNEQVKAITGQDLEEMKKEFEALDKYIKDAEKLLDPSLDKSKKKKSDPRLQILNNIASTMEKINKEYDDLLKKEGETKALADTQRLFEAELANMQKIASKHGFKLPAFEVPKTAQDVAKWYKSVADEIRRLKLKDADKILIDLGYKEGKVDIDEMQRKIEQRLKELSERISQSKTAREFYDKILTQTGDVDIAAQVSMSIYGDTGEGLFEQTIAQIREVFASGVEGVNIPIDTAFDFTNNVIDYGKLAKIYELYQDQLIEANKSTAEKIVSEGQKTAAQNVLTWQKELEKAKDFEEQRTDILNRETQRRAEIIKSNIPQDMKAQLIQLSYDKQAQDISAVNVKEFQASEDYIKIFENLDRVSTKALKRLRTNLAEIIQQNKDLNPENMKQLVKALEQLDNQIEGRGFGNEMIEGVREYFQSFKKLKQARIELQQAQAEYAEQELALNAQIEVAETNHQLTLEELNNLRASGLATTEQIKAAELRVNEAAQAVVKAQQKKAAAVNKVKKKEQEVTDAEDEQLEGQDKFKKGMLEIAQTADKFASVLGDIKDLLGLAEDSAAGVAFDSAIEGLERFSKILTTIVAIQELYNIVTESNPWIAIAAAVLAVGSMLGSWVANEKVRKANKEIERQDKILHSLEYTYERLQKAQEKLFGTEYIKNYREQLEILEAQAAAYKKQMDAEKSKGKKADKDAIQDYKDSWRETLNEIKEMRDDLQEYMMGTDLTSAARDWANAWLEARWSFEDTTEAMKENFADMVQNMIVESMAAKLMENILSPLYGRMEELYKDNVFSAEDIAEIAEMGMRAISQADTAMEGLLARLETAGVDLAGYFSEASDLTGISRDIATASEESINGLAQGINTQNYYISHVPTISENVAAIRMLMEGGSGVALEGGGGLIGMQNEHLAQLPVIAANTLATAERCERAAIACEAIQAAVERVVKNKGNVAVVNTTMY